MYATCEWGQRTHTLSSSSWKVRSCTKRRPKAVGVLNTVQCYSCASCCESTWTMASCFKWLKFSLIFSHILATCFTYSGSNTWLIPQKVSASGWMWMLFSRRESCLFFFFFFPTELEFCGLSKQNVLTNETKRSAQMAEGNQGRIHFGLSKEWGISGHQVSLAVSWNLPPDPFLSLSPNVDTPLVNVNLELRSSLNSTIILYTSPFTCLTQHSHISCRHQVTRFKNSFTWDSDL